MRFVTALLALAIVLPIASFAEPDSFAEPVEATAEKALLDVTDLSDGTYLLTKKGTKITVESATVYKPDSPNPPDPPDPDDLTKRGEEIKNASLLVQGDDEREESARLLAALWREIANSIEDKKILTQEEAALGVKFGTDMLLGERRVKPNWQSVREVLTEQWTDVLQRGGKIEDYETLLREASDGLDASASNTFDNEYMEGGGRYGIDIDMIMRIILLILEIIEKWRDAQVAITASVTAALTNPPAAVVEGVVPAVVP